MTPEEEHKYTQYVLALEKENDNLKDKIIECINCHNEYIHPALCPYCEVKELKERLKGIEEVYNNMRMGNYNTLSYDFEKDMWQAIQKACEVKE